MPLYEYRCEKCGQKFEVRQKFSDEPLATHEGCGGSVERLISAPAFQFKGSGWYVTDYAKSGKSSNGGETSKSSSGEKGEGKKDAAPAASTESAKPASPSSSSETK